MMKIYVLSRQFLQHYRTDPKYKSMKSYLISITEPGSKPVVHPLHVFDHVLSLSFHDVCVDHPGTPYRTIQPSDVHQIVTFVDSLPDDCVLIVQCEAGISRSAGVAGAIAKYVNDDNDWIFKSGKYVPNMTVYNMVLDGLFDSPYKNPDGN
jgi:predicted protein tyrosine phosphatase